MKHTIINYYSKFVLSLALTIIFLSHMQASNSQEASDNPASIIITFFPYDYQSGASQSAITQHEALLAAGAKCLFIGINNDRTKHLSPISCISIEDGYRVLQEVVETKKDAIAVIHCHERGSFIPVSCIAQKFNIPVLITLHSPLNYSNQANDDLPVAIRKAASGIIGVNQKISARQVVLNETDKIKVHVTTIPPFFDHKRLCSSIPLEKNRDVFFKNTFGISLKPYPMLLKVANFYSDVTHKNHALFLRAMHDLVYKRSIPVQAVLAGDGDSIDDSKKRVCFLKLTEWVHFLGKTSFTKELYNYTDINLLSSDKEGLPLVLLEGGLIKKPTIVAREGCGAGGWLVLDNETGFLFENNNAKDLADKIEYVLTHQEEAKACGQRLYQKVINEFLPDKIVQDLLKFYQLVQPKFVLPNA